MSQPAQSGFVYRTSGGNSTRESGQFQLRRRLRSGFTATLHYTFSKSIDDDAMLGGQGHAVATAARPQRSAPSPDRTASIAQNWLDPRAERALSSFDQRHLLNLQASTPPARAGGGTLMSGWRGRLLKEWTVVTPDHRRQRLAGDARSIPAAVPGTGIHRHHSARLPPARRSTRPPAGSHLNRGRYHRACGRANGERQAETRSPGPTIQPDSSMARTFRLQQRFLDVRVDATNLLNHAAFTGWNTTVNSTQFGLPLSANAMRSLQTTLRLRF